MTSSKPQNLLDLSDLEAPVGDLSTRGSLSRCRSIWTAPLPEEAGAPERRIIHARIFTPMGKATIKRLGWRKAAGYHKCGSHQEDDWIVDLRILTLDQPDGPWRVLDYLRDLPLQPDDSYQWLELEDLPTCGLILEIRRCGVDGWWTPWNLAGSAFRVEGSLQEPIAPRCERLLSPPPLPPQLDGLPEGMSAEIHDGEVRYKSPWLELGFFLGRPGLAYLGMDQEGAGRTETNLLRVGPGSFHQGPMLNPAGQAPVADPALRFDFDGKTEIKGNRVRYTLGNSRVGQQHVVEWTVLPRELEFSHVRTGSEDLRAWDSTAWRVAFDPRAAACHLLGRVVALGQTGSVEVPAILHAPKHGSLLIEQNGDGSARLEVYRPADRIDLELQTGQSATSEGDWLLPAGSYRADWRFRLIKPDFPLREETPEPVRAVLERAGHTGLNFRPDTATLSNNGASMHCPISMDTWAAQTTRMGELLPGLPANEFLRISLERWLDGGPGYAAGNLRQGGTIHPAEDEYIMTGTAALLGLAEYLASGASSEWKQRYEPQISQTLARLQARDLDGDGLLESNYRTGVSGTGQWSTCWFDVISYGWKDAFANALLFEALQLLQQCAEDSFLADWRGPLADWAKRLQGAYQPTFFNEKTGWFAGWRCKAGELHDYAFLPGNGAAVAAGLVSQKDGRALLTRLLDEMKRVNMPNARLGLPGNLRPIPDEDLADITQGYPFGYYQNGGRTHSQSRHFLRGLYAAGLDAEADCLLHELCQGMAEGRVYGGCKSGVDWRYWDDRPCGYEGLLTDQFGFVGVALDRYGVQNRTPVTTS